jgi:carbonic anhydrase/acetyltransferase-like protein (isoleucine patch superfamily)
MACYELEGTAPRLPGADEYFIADSAAVIGRVEIGRRASVWFSAVLRGDNEPIRIGDDSNIQDNAVLHTDVGAPLTVGRGCTVGHRAILHSCTVGDYALVGMGATVLNNARIGNYCLVGANALVPEGREFPDRSLIIGMPAKAVRMLTVDEVARLERSAATYVANWQRYRRALRML